MENHKTLPILKRLVPYLLQYKWRVVLSIALLVGARLIGVADPYVLKLIIDTLIDGNGTALMGAIILLVIIYFVIKSSSEFFEGLRTWIFAPVETNIKRFIALDVFSHLLKLPVSFHENRSTGGISRKITRGSSGLEMFLFFVAGNILPTLIELTLISIIFLILFPPLFTLIFIIFVIAFIAYTVWAVDRRQKILLATNKLDDTASGRSIDALMNYETVKYFTNEAYEFKRYGDSLAQWVRSDITSSKMEAYIYRGQGVIVAVGLTSLLGLSIREFTLGAMTVGDLVMVTSYLGRVAVPLSFLGFIYRRLKESLADMDEMFKLLDENNTLMDKEEAKELKNVNGEIVFRDVDFIYNEDRCALSHISFVIPAKKSVAFVGYSGAGKSTISKLLVRLYDVSAGSITIDGYDIRDVSQESLRKNIGVVAQDTPLFNGTIYENIVYGRPGATKEDVERVARIAHLHDFIVRDLPLQYETVVGERGVKLSGGEKQRVAIARMLLKDPAIFIFDEATASLDSKAEKIIQNAISEISQGGRTTIVIAHRLSTIADFDEIVVMDHGNIVERGDHASLMKKDGVYAHLWEIQKNKVSDPAS